MNNTVCSNFSVEQVEWIMAKLYDTDLNILTAEKRGVMNVAHNMKNAGLPVEQIVQMTGLTVSEIEKL
jgi:hypothetical protein